MPRRKNYFDLQCDGGRILRKFAVEIVGSELAFKQALADTLDRPPYSVSRYMGSLTQKLLMPDFDLLEHGIKEALDACSKEDNLYDVRPENVKRQRERYEAEFMQELHKLHEEANRRCID